MKFIKKISNFTRIKDNVGKTSEDADSVVNDEETVVPLPDGRSVNTEYTTNATETWDKDKVNGGKLEKPINYQYNHRDGTITSPDDSHKVPENWTPRLDLLNSVEVKKGKENIAGKEVDGRIFSSQISNPRREELSKLEDVRRYYSRLYAAKANNFLSNSDFLRLKKYADNNVGGSNGAPLTNWASKNFIPIMPFRRATSLEETLNKFLGHKTPYQYNPREGFPFIERIDGKPVLPAADTHSGILYGGARTDNESDFYSNPKTPNPWNSNLRNDISQQYARKMVFSSDNPLKIASQEEINHLLQAQGGRISNGFYSSNTSQDDLKFITTNGLNKENLKKVLLRQSVGKFDENFYSRLGIDSYAEHPAEEIVSIAQQKRDANDHGFVLNDGDYDSVINYLKGYGLFQPSDNFQRGLQAMMRDESFKKALLQERNIFEKMFEKQYGRPLRDDEAIPEDIIIPLLKDRFMRGVYKVAKMNPSRFNNNHFYSYEKGSIV